MKTRATSLSMPSAMGATAALTFGSPAVLAIAGATAVSTYAWRMALAGPYMAMRFGTGTSSSDLVKAATKQAEAIVDATLKVVEEAVETTADVAETAVEATVKVAEEVKEAVVETAPAASVAVESAPSAPKPAAKPVATKPAAKAVDPAPAPKATPAAAKPVAKAEPAAAKPAAKTVKPAPTAKAAPAAPEPVVAEAPASDLPEMVQPKALKAPRKGVADDLTAIKGIGPKLAEKLGTMGIFHYSQIASWTEAEVAWMDENLGRPTGRVSRDNWVAAAAALKD